MEKNNNVEEIESHILKRYELLNKQGLSQFLYQCNWSHQFLVGYVDMA